MRNQWKFEPNGRGGCLKLDGRPIAFLTPASPGHILDTGQLIADLLNDKRTTDTRSVWPEGAEFQ